MGAVQLENGTVDPPTGEIVSAESALHGWQPHPELPAWFNAFRAAAREAYMDNELPGYGDEAWHYGKAKRFTLEGVNLPGTADHPGGRAAGLLELAGPEATVAGWCGLLELVNVNEHDTAGGLRLSMLSDLAREGGAEALSTYWTEQAPQVYGQKLAGAHYALTADPAVLIIPRNFKAAAPVQLSIDAGPGGSLATPQLLVLAGENSQAEVILTVSSEDSTARQLILASTRCYLAAGANLRLSRLQHLGNKTDSLTWEQVDCARDATYTSVNALFGGSNARLEAVANLREPGSTAYLYGGCVGQGRQTYDFLTHQNHLAPQANSNLLYKSALLGRSQVSYQGTITVHPGAQKTDAYQKNRSLVLSPQARSNSSPQLEIKADDVRCSHGSTTSNVSGAEMFYLRSRGIGERAARQLLVEAFLGEIARQFHSPALQDYIAARVLEQV
jgi:Fe-S cluster assembly protein SufD